MGSKVNLMAVSDVLTRPSRAVAVCAEFERVHVVHRAW